MKRTTELKAISEGTFKYVAKQFDDAVTDHSLMLIQAEQVLPSPALIEEFERGRTRIEAALRARGEKLTTRQLWAAPPDEHYDSTLEHGFFGAFRGAPVAFFADPARALGTTAPPRRLFLCRVALGVPGSDYSETAGALLVYSQTALPAFVCTWRRKTTSTSVSVFAGPAVAPSAVPDPGPMPKRCSACGQAASDPGARFCISCGAKF